MKFLGNLFQNAAGQDAFAAAGAITYAEASLSADVQLTTSNVFVSGPSVVLPAGTWLVLGQAQYQRNATTAAQVTARLWSGAEEAAQNIYHASLSGITLGFNLQAVVVLAASTTVSLQMATNAGSTTSLMKSAAPTNGVGNNATTITAVRLG